MPEGQQFLVKHVEGPKAILDAGRAVHRYLIVPRAPVCTHGSLKPGGVLTVRASPVTERPSALAGTRVEAPCACVFVLIADPFTS